MSITPAQCRAARALLDITQDQLSERAVVSKRAIAAFESGSHKASAATLKLLRQALESWGLAFSRTGVAFASELPE